MSQELMRIATPSEELQDISSLQSPHVYYKENIERADPSPKPPNQFVIDQQLLPTPDPHEYFRSQTFSYPVKDEEQSFMNKFFSEKMTGLGTLPTGKCSSFCNIVGFFFFVIFGLVFLQVSANIKEIRVRYDDVCTNQTICQVNFNITDDIQAPFYIYYELNQFYSNHRYYVDSFQSNQMNGGILTQKNQGIYCVDALLNRDMPHGNSSTLNSGSGYILDDSQPANPCGTAAKYIFNDTYQLTGPTKNQSVYMNQTGITYFVDSKFKFSKSKYFPFLQWLDINNQHVMNWFGIQTLPYIKKLWARIDLNLDSGSYQMLIYNNYLSQIFMGTKTLVLSTSSEIGTKNLLFGYILLSISGFYLLGFFYIFLRNARKQNLRSKRVQPINNMDDEDTSLMKSKSKDVSSFELSKSSDRKKLKLVHPKED